MPHGASPAPAAKPSGDDLWGRRRHQGRATHAARQRLGHRASQAAAPADRRAHQLQLRRGAHRRGRAHHPGRPAQGSSTCCTRRSMALSPWPQGHLAPDQAVFLLESALSVNGSGNGARRAAAHVGRADALKGVSSGVRQINTAAMPPRHGAHHRAAAIHRRGRNGHPAPHDARRQPAARDTRAQPADPRRHAARPRLAGNRQHLRRRPAQGMSVGVFPLKYASVAEVEAAPQLIAGGGGATAAAPGGGPRLGPAPLTTQSTAQAGAATPAALAENNPCLAHCACCP